MKRLFKKLNIVNPGKSPGFLFTVMVKRVSIQGYEGSFHQVAAEAYLGKQVEVIPCATFREVIKIASTVKGCDGAMMAIENSIAGSILPNYSLIQKSNLQICGEIFLHIRQHLMANPGVKLTDLTEVHSHPMALLQCIDYLDKFPQWKLVESEDTALSAKQIHQYHRKHAAAIAGKLAADLFKLEILAPNIQSDKKNYTRFLFLRPKNYTAQVDGPDKASINFHTDHSRGSLAKVLTQIAEFDINLSKLQSMPLPGKQWHYSFHADLEFNNQDNFTQAMEKIKPITSALNIFGMYKKGVTVY